MPWCPNCKLEYEEGVTVCTDCSTPLVEEKPLEQFQYLASAAEESLANNLVEFLHYSHIDSAKYEWNEEEYCYTVFVLESDYKESKKLYIGFIEGQKELAEKDIEQLKVKEQQEQTSKLRTAASTVYVKKEDKYEDFHSSFVIFSLFGVIGLLVTLLNIAGIFHFMNSLLQQIVLSIIFVLFIVIGISSRKRATELKKEINTEETITNQLMDWLTSHITKEWIQSIHDPALSEEENYFKKTEQIKSWINEEFDQLEDNFLDAIIEEYYNKQFE